MQRSLDTLVDMTGALRAPLCGIVEDSRELPDHFSREEELYSDAVLGPYLANVLDAGEIPAFNVVLRLANIRTLFGGQTVDRLFDRGELHDDARELVLSITGHMPQSFDRLIHQAGHVHLREGIYSYSARVDNDFGRGPLHMSLAGSKRLGAPRRGSPSTPDRLSAVGLPDRLPVISRSRRRCR